MEHKAYVPVQHHCGHLVPIDQQQPSSGAKMEFQDGYPKIMTHSAMVVMEALSKSNKKEKSKREKFITLLAILFLCIGIIIKGFAYSSSSWAKSDYVDAYENLDKFPLMTQFLNGTQTDFNGNCQEQQCKLFFRNYQTQIRANEWPSRRQVRALCCR